MGGIRIDMKRPDEYYQIWPIFGDSALGKLDYNTAATGLFCRGGKIESRLLIFCQSHATSLSEMAKCD